MSVPPEPMFVVIPDIWPYRLCAVFPDQVQHKKALQSPWLPDSVRRITDDVAKLPAPLRSLYESIA